MQYKIFGCKTNKYYTEKWLNTKYLEDKPGIFVASCIVTEKAKSKWLRFVISTIKKFEQGDEKIYLSGCGTIKKGNLVKDFYSTYPELKIYENRIVLLGEDPIKEGIAEKIGNIRNKLIFTRKYLIIQNGCDNYCTFCVTIQARGNHTSRNAEDIILEIRDFVASGGKEVVITGTNLGAWGTENTREFKETKFAELLALILEKTEIERLRISSLGIEYITPELIEIFKNRRIYSHLHLSIQSGSDKILKLMNRNYSREILIEKLKGLKGIKREDGVELSIGADFIIGFPGEDENDFEDSIDIIRQFQITKVHAFPFSAHENRDSIPAAKFPNQIKEHIKSLRMKQMLKIGDEIRNDFLKRNSEKELLLLAEKVVGDKFSGWSENYIFLNEDNFKPYDSPVIKRGDVIKGIYAYNPQIKEIDGDGGF